MPTSRILLALGAGFGLLSVALGAFAAHALRPRLDETLLAAFNTGVEYQAMHAFALLATGLLAERGRHTEPALVLAGAAFAGGVLLFSGSLYLLALTGQRGLGIITPFGGVSLLVGWAALIWHSLHRDR